MANQIPIVDYLVLDDGGPHLEANECTKCGALFFDRRNACAKCANREFTKRTLGTTGVVRSFAIVHQAAPGVPVPYVSSVVDLDGGGDVKANVVNVGGIGQQVAKQVGQTGIPIYNVVNACATGATAVRTALLEIQAGNADFGLAIGAEQMGKMGLLAGNAARGEANKFEPSGRYGSVMPVDGWRGSGTMPVAL